MKKKQTKSKKFEKVAPGKWRQVKKISGVTKQMTLRTMSTDEAIEAFADATKELTEAENGYDSIETKKCKRRYFLMRAEMYRRLDLFEKLVNKMGKGE